jgi:hypothetical protein
MSMRVLCCPDALAPVLPPGSSLPDNLLGDSSPLEDVAGRLSARLGKLVLLASALGASEGSAWMEAALLQLLASRAGAGSGGGSGGAAATSGSGTAAGGAS